MKTIKAKFLSEDFRNNSLLNTEDNFIKTNNWNYPCKVEAMFDIGFNANNIYMRFDIKEWNSIAIHTKINDPVYEDSCVEFFISFDTKNYYNFEFNCIGNILGGYGQNRDGRTFLDEKVLKSVVTLPSLGKNRIEILGREINWTLDVTIPKKVFVYDHLDSLINKEATCNFYKCGDKLAQPHFLSWNPIKSESPNFHKPEFFGQLLFNTLG